MIQITLEGIYPFINQNDLYSLQSDIDKCFQLLTEKKGKGNEFTGWVDLPSETLNAGILDEIVQEAEKLQKISEVVVVTGIGGSYLGSRAIIEALSHHFHQFFRFSNTPEIVYAGQNIGQDYMFDLLQLLHVKDYSIIVISKSGTTTEPAIAFRLLKKHIEEKYGKSEATKRIIAITDQSKGALKKLADKEGYKTFVIPDDVGGRFSVLTPVGTLPIAVAGFDVKKLIEGAMAMQNELNSSSRIDDNIACKYAAVRNALYNKGKTIEILANFQPNLTYLSEWWKQLFGESEGKDNKGIFTASVNFSTDLHSLGQYIQDGLRIIFETMLLVEKTKNPLNVPREENDSDGLNFVADKSISYVNNKASEGTALAHIKGGVPVISITIPEVNEFYLGALMYFFEFSCGISGYLLDVNPFNQPGVEEYKNNMFALLDKPGYEDLKKKILNKS